MNSQFTRQHISSIEGRPRSRTWEDHGTVYSMLSFGFSPSADLIVSGTPDNMHEYAEALRVFANEINLEASRVLEQDSDEREREWQQLEKDRQEEHNQAVIDTTAPF